jgi:hypothetical protein
MGRKQDPIRKYFKKVGIDEKRQSCKFFSKETKKKFKQSTIQISTLDVDAYDVINDQVQVQSTSKEVPQLQIQQHSENFSRFFDKMDKGENAS